MTETWALVVGHGDDPQLLARNLRHHLDLGASAILVSTITEDPAAAEVVARFAAEGVSHRIAGRNGEDAFLYFEYAGRELMDRGEFDWIGFIDTDEFVVTEGPALAFAADADVVSLTRYNALPLRRDGVVHPPELEHLRATVLAAGSDPIEGPWSSGDMRIAYVDGVDLGPKVFARPRAMSSVVSGGHGISTALPFVRRAVARDAILVHVPFSTAERFRRKVAGIRILLAGYGHRFDPWQWKYWAAMDDEQLDAEFERQVADVEAATRRTTDAALILSDFRSASAALTPREWTFVARSARYEPPPAMGVLQPADIAMLSGAFDATTYVARHADLAAEARANPQFDAFEHFCRHGVAEGREPSYAFDSHATLAALVARFGDAQHVRDVWWLYFALSPADRPIPNTWFDAAWYRGRYGETASDWDAFAQYLARVRDDARSPNAWFDESAYRAARPEALASAGIHSGFQHCWLSMRGAHAD